MRTVQFNALLGLLLSVLFAAGCASTPEPRPEPGREMDAATLSTLILISEIAFERGECKIAAESYADAAAQLRNAAHTRRALEIALACEHLPAAWQAATYWRSLAPTDGEVAALYAAVALKLHRIARAREAVQAVMAAGGFRKDEDLIDLTTLLLEEAAPSSVLAVISGALEGTSPSPPILAMLAELALKTPDLARAKKYVDQALQADPNLLSAKRILSQIYVQRHDADNAIATAREIMGMDKKGGTFELADTLAALERLEEAREELDRLRAVANSDAAEIDRRLALLAMQSGDYAEAERRFVDLTLRGQVGEAALMYIAEIAALGGDKDAALSGYQQLADSSLALEARLRAAGILLERGKHAEAMALLDDYAAQNPTSSFNLTLAKARLLAEHGESEKGLSLLVTAQHQHPDHPALLYDQAVLLERAGRLDEAIEVLEGLLSQRPEDPMILNALGYTLADHGRELEAAEDLIRRALAVTPDSPAVLDSLGWVRFRRGDFAGAADLLERAYELGHDPEIAAHWGEALWASGDKQAARRVWANALARDPDSSLLKATLARFLPPAAP